MGLSSKISTWVHKDFLSIIITITVFIYLRWFWLTPLVFKYYNDPNAGFIVGVVLFVTLLMFTIIYRFVKNRFLKIITSTLIALLSLINI